MTSPHSPQDASGTDGHIDVVRREQRLLIATEVHATERVRLERYIVTEQQTFTVDVSREEVRLTREPITGGTRLPTGTDIADREPIVVVLHEERVTVSKAVVPVERVTLSTHRLTEDRVVEETLGHEEIDVDLPGAGRDLGR